MTDDEALATFGEVFARYIETMWPPKKQMIGTVGYFNIVGEWTPPDPHEAMIEPRVKPSVIAAALRNLKP